MALVSWSCQYYKFIAVVFYHTNYLKEKIINKIIYKGKYQSTVYPQIISTFLSRLKETENCSNCFIKERMLYKIQLFLELIITTESEWTSSVLPFKPIWCWPLLLLQLPSFLSVFSFLLSISSISDAVEVLDSFFTNEFWITFSAAKFIFCQWVNSYPTPSFFK